MKLKIAVLLTLIAIGLHTYLTLHYYDLNFGGATGESVCNVSETFNCDQASTSRFASVFNVPLALWGAAAHLVLLVWLVGWMIGWTDNISRLSRSAFTLSVLIASASVVMGIISIAFLTAYCLFCMAAYALSFANVALIYSELDEAPNLPLTFKEWLTSKSYLLSLAAIPALAGFYHLSATRQPQIANIQRQSAALIAQWQNAPAQNFDQAPLLTLGDSAPKMTITEFADFRCHHCKNAAPALKTFAQSRPGVALHFFVFPLEKVPEADPQNSCISCNLAKAVICSSQTAETGWKMHDKIFAEQDAIIRMDAPKVTEAVKKYASDLNVNADEFATCYAAPETHNRVRQISEMAQKAMITSTPTIFVNQKKLSGGQLIPILEGVYKTLR